MHDKFESEIIDFEIKLERRLFDLQLSIKEVIAEVPSKIDLHSQDDSMVLDDLNTPRIDDQHTPRII